MPLSRFFLLSRHLFNPKTTPPLTSPLSNVTVFLNFSNSKSKGIYCTVQSTPLLHTEPPSCSFTKFSLTTSTSVPEIVKKILGQLPAPWTIIPQDSSLILLNYYQNHKLLTPALCLIPSYLHFLSKVLECVVSTQLQNTVTTPTI